MAGKGGWRSAGAGPVYPHPGRGRRPYLADGRTGTARPGCMSAPAYLTRHDNAVTIRTTIRYAAALLVAASMLCCGLLQAAQIKNVRLWRAPDNTRLVFDLRGPADHTLFTLASPERIVIDISGTTFNASTSNLALENTPLTGLRSAPRDGSDLRVVLDLSRQVTAKSFSLPPNQQYGHRLVIDLYDQEPAPSLPPRAEPSASPLPQTPT